MILLIFAILLVSVTPAFAVDAYVDVTLGADCTTSNYDRSARTCTGTDGNAYNTIKKCIDLLVPGNACYLRGGTYTERIDLQANHIEGSANNYIIIGGYPGETVIIQCADPTVNGYGCVKHRGGTLSYGWIIFQDFIVDGTGMANQTGWWVGDNNHDMIIRRVEVRNQKSSGFYLTSSNNILFEDVYIHSADSIDCSVGLRWHGYYIHHSTNITIRRNTISDMPGIGVQIFPGPNSGITVENSDIHHTTKCATVNNGALVVYSSTTGGAIDNVVISGNLIHDNGLSAGGQYLGGAGGGIRVLAANASLYPTNLRIENNTIVNNTYNTSCTDGGCTGYGIWFSDNNNGTPTVKNNIIIGNTQGSVFTGTGNVSQSFNGCTSGTSCGSTGKVTMTALTDCLVSSSDLRLKTGATNICRNAGTSVLSRPTPVGVTDLGAFEQGSFTSATALGTGGLEVVGSLGTPGFSPSSGITGLTVACVGCTGSPSVTSAVVKAGSNTTLQLNLSGITVAGTCTVSLGASNLTDSGFVGRSSATAQLVNTVSAMSVSGNCANSGGSGTGVTYSTFLLADGSGTVAADSSGNAHPGTVSTGVTWVNDSSGTGVTIPSDATYRYVSSTYGNAVNPTTQDFAACAVVLPDLQYDQKVVISSTTNGTNQRWYAGWFNVSGQKQWGIGAQSSGFTTGSEFPVVAQKTLICLVNDSTTDTVTLWVNGVKGAVSGKSVKSVTSYTLAGNIAVGADGVNTVNNGGQTVYELYVWNTKPSDSSLQTLYTDLFPAGGAGSCYSQANHQAQLTHLSSAGGSPVNHRAAGATIDVIDGGSVYLKIQVDCTGSAGTAVSFVPRYSKDGAVFNLAIPASFGVDGIAMAGTTSDTTVNRFEATCCISGALTANNGTTILTATASDTVTLSQNHSYTLGILIKFAPGQAGQSFWIKLYQDNGQALSRGYNPSTGIRINIGSASANASS